MAFVRHFIRRVVLLSAVTVASLCFLAYSGHHTQTLRDDVTSYPEWSREVEAKLEAHNVVQPNSNKIKRTNASEIMPIYLNGKLVVETENDSGKLENLNTPALPVELPAMTECPSQLGVSMADYKTFRNLSLRHPRAMLEYVAPRETPPIVILTPVSSATKYLQRYFGHLCSLTYPHSQISVVLGEDSSQDNTYQESLTYLKELQPYFRNVKLYKLKPTENPWPYEYRHEESYQRPRRTHLAKSRNQLLSAGLQDETWVLWLDSDIKYIPPDIIEQLMSAQEDIVVPACMYVKANGIVEIYDKNTWKETEESRNFLRTRGKEYLMLEGYAATMRLYLDSLRVGRRVVEIDGVGGCVMLVKADVHRNGLIFPPFIFDHAIETEALGRMAQEMGYHVHGMPYVEVFH